MSVESKEALSKLEEHTLLCDSLQREKTAAIAVLHQHNIPWRDHVTSHVTELQNLQAQNKELHAIIKQMRTELEQLSDLTEQRENAHQREGTGKPSLQYVSYLENDVCKLKSENRQLAERLAQVSKPPTPKSSRRQAGPTALEHPSTTTGTAGPLSVSSGDSHVARQQQKHRDQLIALSDTIASLQREKGQLERVCEECKGKAQMLQDKLKEEKEMVSSEAAG